MKLADEDLRQLADIAVSAAIEAGEMIAESRPSEIGYKSGAGSLSSQVVTEIDRRSEDIIVDRLTPTLQRFELALLTEEQEDDRSRLTADHFWCIDPLDGTLPFIEGSSGYAVSIALVSHDGTPCIGVVYDPVDAVVLHAIAGAGAFRDGQAWELEQPKGDELSLFADRSFFENEESALLVASLESTARDLGLAGVRIRTPRGAVMNACGVLTNSPACYFKRPGTTGGGSLWDFAATACLFGELNAVATDMAGERLDLNRSDSTFMNHRGVLFATDASIAQRIHTL